MKLVVFLLLFSVVAGATSQADRQPSPELFLDLAIKRLQENDTAAASMLLQSLKLSLKVLLKSNCSSRSSSYGIQSGIYTWVKGVGFPDNNIINPSTVVPPLHVRPFENGFVIGESFFRCRSDYRFCGILPFSIHTDSYEYIDAETIRYRNSGLYGTSGSYHYYRLTSKE